MQIRMADLQAQYQSIRSEIDGAVAELLGSSQFILGPAVAALEEEIAAYCQAKHAVGVASGTDAITLALAACGVGPGDEVVTTPFTFVATTETIVQLGAKPVYADIDPATFVMRVDLTEEKITPRTKAILPVHLYGQTVDLEAFEELAARRRVALISDGAQAIGARHRGKGIGAYGDAATLSFFPTKNLGAAGDGGMVLTNDDVVAERIRLLRFHGSGGTYDYRFVGWCSRLDALQAAILRVKLRHLDGWNAARARHAKTYSSLLASSGGVIPFVPQENQHVWHQYTVRCERRDELKDFLQQAGISSAVYYPGALHLERAYAYLGYSEGDLPEAERACREVLSLPVYPDLPQGAPEAVAHKILEFDKSLAAT